MSESVIRSQLASAADDISHIREALEATLAYLRERGEPWAFSGVLRVVDDHYVIGKIGDVQIRLEVAAALHERATALTGQPEQRLIASSEAVIASAEALKATLDTQQELTGQRSTLSSQGVREPLRWHYQIIGNYRLNGVVPPQLQE